MQATQLPVMLPEAVGTIVPGGSSASGEEKLLTPRMRRSHFVPEKGETTPGGKLMDCSPIPRGPRWSDICDDELSEGEENEEVQREPDASPKSPSKSARRANRRRRCREAARDAADADAEAAEKDPFSFGAASAGAQGGKMMLPAGAFINAGFVGQLVPGNCTPTCVASPVRSSPVRGAAVSLPLGAFADPDASPTQPRLGCLVSVMSTSPQAQGIVGDASTRTPTAASCASPYMCGATASACSDASARTPGARLVIAPAGAWGVLGSPSARGSLSFGPSIVSTSPMAAIGAGVIPIPMPCGPAGSAAADTLRSLLGPGGMAQGDELAARLRAAAPEIYED